MILTRAGSASALRRRATFRASSSLMGPAASGAQHAGAVMSTTGNVFGIPRFCHKALTYIKIVACWPGSNKFDICLTPREVCPHVPRTTRPQRRQPRRCCRLLLQAVQYRASETQDPATPTSPSLSHHSSWCSWRTPEGAARSTTWAWRSSPARQSHEEIARLQGEGLFTDEEIGTTCCFATQDKVWVTGPAGEKWEVYTVLADSETFGSNPQHLDRETEGAACCGGSPAGGDQEAASARS